MRIKKFKESISGWELVGKDMGPNYPQQNLPNSLGKDDTTVILGMDGKFYTQNDFIDLYNLYLKSGGKEDLSEFNERNLDQIINIFS